MAPNKFATMIHRKTNRITLVLVYAVLEWALIFFLLLNSLFSYLIIKFAHYFGLKPPCLLCSRLDHIFEPQNSKSGYRKLFCEQHAIELSKSGYCLNNRNLEDCSSSHQHNHQYPSVVLEDTQKVNRDELIHPSDFDEESDQSNDKDRDIQMGNESDLVNEGDNSDGFSFWLPKGGNFTEEDDEDEGDVVLKEETKPVLKVSTKGSYANETVLPQPIEFYIDLDDYQLVPVELVSLEMEKSKGDLLETDDSKIEDFSTEQGQEVEIMKEIDIKVDFDDTNILDSTSKQGDGMVEIFQVADDQAQDIPVISIGDKKSNELNSNILTEDFEDVCHIENEEAKVEDLPTKQGQELEMKREISIKVDLDEIKGHEEEIKMELSDVVVLEGQEDQDAGDQPRDAQLSAIDDQITEETELNANILIKDSGDFCYRENDETQAEDLPAKQGQELGNMELDDTETNELSNEKDHQEKENKEVDDAMLLETNKVIISPSMHEQEETTGREMCFQDSAIDDQVTEETEQNQLNDDVATSDSKQTEEIQNHDNDGVGNELDNDDGVATIEELKSVLKSEREALHALYAELEEERHAAAIATNETMAMISRLQEEKATIEMEALQYQRLMEEQSEYDQEALQLMNEILVKREKELQEAETELGIFRKKVQEYEERERMRLSVTLDNGHHEDTPVDEIVNLQDSFSVFEDERLSILEQLKILEKKLCTLNGENGSTSINGNHHDKTRMNGQKPKQLLPLFDAAELESDDEQTGIKTGSDPDVMTSKSPTVKFELENERRAIEEEVDYMYERLHALEADREFVKNCIGSLRKGERGVHLLQEILQHLRDLKNVELQARNVYSL